MSINNNLNSDCLIKIFEFLPNEDKLTTELVCRRWKNLIKSAWMKVKNFQIIENNLESENKLYVNYYNLYKNVIKRSGPYLNRISIERNVDNDYSEIFNEISKNCKNVTDFTLKCYDISLDKNLDLVFKKNKSISRIALSYINTNVSLSYLNAEAITELIMNFCCFNSEKSLYKFFSELKNLKIIDIKDSDINVNNMISSLSKSKCENIEKFSIDLDENVCYSELTTFLSKQTQLKVLTLRNSSLNKEFLNNLKNLPLEECNV